MMMMMKAIAVYFYSHFRIDSECSEPDLQSRAKMLTILLNAAVTLLDLARRAVAPPNV